MVKEVRVGRCEGGVVGEVRWFIEKARRECEGGGGGEEEEGRRRRRRRSRSRRSRSRSSRREFNQRSNAREEERAMYKERIFVNGTPVEGVGLGVS